MKTTVTFHHNRAMFNLGVQTWWPAISQPHNWKKAGLEVFVGPFSVELIVGSKKRYKEIHKTLDELYGKDEENA